MHSNNGFNSMLTTTPDLTRRTPEAEGFYNVKTGDYVNMHIGRPVVIGRNNPHNAGITLEYARHGGRTWQIVSYHKSIAEAITAFRNLDSGKDSDPTHYRILMEG